MGEPWPLVPLGEVLIKSSETTPIHPDRTYSEVTVRMWGNGVVLRRVATGAEIAADRRAVVHAGEFILSRIDARNGAFGIVPASLNGAVVSNDFPSFRPVEDRLATTYLGWLSKTASFVDLCRRASEGTTNRVRLKEELFLRMPIPLPAIEEQQRIVARIETIAAKVQEARRLRRGAVEGISALRKSSAHALLTRFSGRKRPLADLVSVRGGGTPSKGNPFYWEGSIPWISPKDMKSRELADARDHISEQAVRETAAKLIDPGAVLIVVRGMILAHTVPAATLRVAAAVNQDMKALIPADGLVPEFLCSALWAMNQDLLRLVEKSTHDTRKLETSKLMGFEIPVPAVDEQRAFLEALEAVETLLAQVQAQQNRTEDEFAAILPSLLDRAFRGEL